jgi:pimeloyl-ACP methyl ester carboxylesterase
MREFRAEDGARLAYRDEGTGMPLLALPGLTRDGRDFDYLARHLRGVRLIRLDPRGRGASDWTGADSYTLAQETRDVLALLDHLRLADVAILGTSRGGLIGMALAATARSRVRGLCLNDVGPDLQPEGLTRIARYVGLAPDAQTLPEMAARLPAAMAGFANVSAERWLDEARRHFRQTGNGLALTYDPELRAAFLTALEGPAFDLWPLFQALEGLPVALIRGANSDLLSAATAAEMRRRRPDLILAEVPDRGHIPFLDEPQSLAAIAHWLGALGLAGAVASL